MTTFIFNMAQFLHPSWKIQSSPSYARLAHRPHQSKWFDAHFVNHGKTFKICTLLSIINQQLIKTPHKKLQYNYSILDLILNGKVNNK